MLHRLTHRLTRAKPLLLVFALVSASCGDGETAVNASTAASPTTAVAPADVAGCPATDGSQTKQQEFPDVQPFCIDPELTYVADVVTSKGSFTIELDPAIAPQTVNNFVTLARFKYFDQTVCHRIIPGFVVQCGDPTATGTGNPGYRFSDELPEAGQYLLGSVAMANSGPDTNGSQFFIITGESGAALPPLYSLFGQVTSGLETTIADLDQLGSGGGTPTTEVVIESVTISEA